MATNVIARLHSKNLLDPWKNSWLAGGGYENLWIFYNEKNYSKYQIVDIEFLELLKMVMSHNIIDILILVRISNFTTFSGPIDK